MAQMVKSLSTMRETWVQSLGWEESQEKGTAIHSSILAQRIPWTEKPGGLQSMQSQRVRQDESSIILDIFMCLLCLITQQPYEEVTILGLEIQELKLREVIMTLMSMCFHYTCPRHLLILFLWPLVDFSMANQLTYPLNKYTPSLCCCCCC